MNKKEEHHTKYDNFIANRLNLFCLFVFSNIVPMIKVGRNWNLFIGGWFICLFWNEVVEKAFGVDRLRISF